MHFNCIGVTTSRGTLRFLFLPWWGWNPWSLSPIYPCMLSPLMIIYLAPLVPTLVAPSCTAWSSSTFCTLSCCWMVGMMLVLGIQCGYIHCDRFFGCYVRYDVCGGVVGSMGAVVLSAWTSWRIFLRTLLPSAPLFPLPRWLSMHILLLLLLENPHQLGLMWYARLFHSPPVPVWSPLFRRAVAHNL